MDRMKWPGVGLVTMLVVMAAILAGGGGEPATTAHLWVDADGGTCTREATPAEYVDAAACSSLDAANDVCEVGDLALVRPGTYAAQTITGLNGRTGSATARTAAARTDPETHCTIQAQGEPSEVRLRGLRVGNASSTDGSQYLVVKGFEIIRASGNQQSVALIFSDSTDVTYQDMDAANFYVRDTVRTAIVGGDWGPCLTTNNDVNDSCSNSKFDSSGAETNSDALVDGGLFHDYRNNLDLCLPSPGSIDCHFEAMFLRGISGITVRNSKFRDNAFFNIFVQGGSQAVEDITIENNWFDPPWNDQADPPTHGRENAVMLSNGADDVLIRFNSFHPLTGVTYDGSSITDIRVIGNILKTATSIPGATYAYNLTNGTAFSGTGNENIGSTFPYATIALSSTANFALDPATGSDADGHVTGEGDDYDLATDINGAARTAGARSAGSVE